MNKILNNIVNTNKIKKWISHFQIYLKIIMEIIFVNHPQYYKVQIVKIFWIKNKVLYNLIVFKLIIKNYLNRI